MPLSRPEAVALFPTGGAIPEELQIGRSAVIEDLTASAEGGQTLIFAENRHLGKSSLLLAMVDRILATSRGRKALSVDLRDGIDDSGALAAALLAQEDALEVQREIAIAIKRASSTVSFVLSGSEKHTLLGLYHDAEAPLQGLGRRFQLPEISRDDWCAGLAQRFARAGVGIASAQLHQIVYSSEGHPLRTMLICVHVLDWLEDDWASQVTVERAVADAQRHPSWSTA